MVVNIDDVDDFVRQDLIRTFEKCGVRMEFNNESEIVAELMKLYKKFAGC